MIACIGYIVPEYFRWPGDLSPKNGISFADVPNGLAAASKVPGGGWLQIVMFAGVMEVLGFGTKKTDEPGNYGAGSLGCFILGPVRDAETRKKKLNAELANGRLAMMAIIGMFYQDGLTGSAWGDWALYDASPLRAFEEELGVQPPVGFWDPLGLSSNGDQGSFLRRREVEIKHGRISMIACIGYIVPEYFRWPGDLSPKNGISFADVPNGLAAASKVPGGGWLQIVMFAGVMEVLGFGTKKTDEPGNYGAGSLGCFILGPVRDAETRKKKLNAELANGRLAMMAIIGMFYQDGLTGSAWGDWALYDASPLRAFESELGVQAPFGFWDPIGFTRSGDELAYKRRRVTEIKHGRVCMLATLGYIVPETLGKFRADLSPSQGLKFSDIP